MGRYRGKKVGLKNTLLAMSTAWHSSPTSTSRAYTQRQFTFSWAQERVVLRSHTRGHCSCLGSFCIGFCSEIFVRVGSCCTLCLLQSVLTSVHMRLSTRIRKTGIGGGQQEIILFHLDLWLVRYPIPYFSVHLFQGGSFLETPACVDLDHATVCIHIVFCVIVLDQRVYKPQR